MFSKIPLELYDGIISYLWDDQDALRACSLAGRILTVASQKRLFYQIILDSCQNDGSDNTNIGGTSSAFHNLLKGSPQIAKYVQCLQIFDIDGYPDSSENISENWSRPSEESWLTNDVFLPLFAPLLCHLKAFVLLYLPDWDHLCEKVRRSLEDLIQLPSLVYVDIAPRPTILLRESFSNNLKHLVLRVDGRPPRYPTPPELEPSESPIYLESFFIAKGEPNFLTRLTSDPKFRFKTSCLRQLVLDISTDKTFQHFALQPLLQSCRESLEQFTFLPSIESLSKTDISAPQFTSFDLSQMTALKTLTLYFDIPDPTNWDPLWCLNNLIRSVSSTCQQLQDITAIMELYGTTFSDPYWNETCGILLNPTRFPRLRKLSIYAMDSDGGGAPAFLALLENSESTARLRARPGIEVVTSVNDLVNLWVFAPDKRWENLAFQYPM